MLAPEAIEAGISAAASSAVVTAIASTGTAECARRLWGISFSPTGLAVGLALREERYTAIRPRFAPRDLGPPLPCSYAGNSAAPKIPGRGAACLAGISPRLL